MLLHFKRNFLFNGKKQTTSRCVLQEKMEMYDLVIAFLPVKNRPSVVMFDKNSINLDRSGHYGNIKQYLRYTNIIFRKSLCSCFLIIQR